MTPTLGRTLIYVLSENDATAINRPRTDGPSIARRMNEAPPAWPYGAQAHIGSTVAAGMEFPGVVVKSMPGPNPTLKPLGAGDPEGTKLTLGTDERDFVNLQVFLDGNDVFWAQAVPGDNSKTPAHGTWHWPARE